MRPTVTVCSVVCLLDTSASAAKTSEPIAVSSGGMDSGATNGPKNHV